VPESGPLGSVRGDRGNPVPYRDTADDVSKSARRCRNRVELVSPGRVWGMA
jgi:hypothetical protein